MTTRECVEKQPQHIRDRIELIRKDYKNPAIPRGKTQEMLYGYTLGLRDAGAITERERQILFVYGTV